jgi:hypothetical protein
MSTITVAATIVVAIMAVAITVVTIMAVAITVVTMVIPGGATLMLMLILIHIPMLILILIRTFILILSPSTTAGVGVLGKGVTIVAAKARFDRGGTSRHGFGACGVAGAAIFLSLALSSSESPRAPAQCASSRKAAARSFAASLWSRKGETGLLK